MSQARKAVEWRPGSPLNPVLVLYTSGKESVFDNSRIWPAQSRCRDFNLGNLRNLQSILLARLRPRAPGVLGVLAVQFPAHERTQEPRSRLRQPSSSLSSWQNEPNRPAGNGIVTTGGTGHCEPEPGNWNPSTLLPLGVLGVLAVQFPAHERTHAAHHQPSVSGQ